MIQLIAANDACIQDLLWSLGLAWASGKSSSGPAQRAAFDLFSTTLETDLSNPAMFRTPREGEQFPPERFEDTVGPSVHPLCPIPFNSHVDIEPKKQWPCIECGKLISLGRLCARCYVEDKY